jgi:hypothetical protein
MKFHRIRSWWRRWRRGPLIDEICRECFAELHARDAWQVSQHFANTAEMGALGGTYMTAYYCSVHRPEGALRAVVNTA